VALLLQATKNRKSENSVKKRISYLFSKVNVETLYFVSETTYKIQKSMRKGKTVTPPSPPSPSARYRFFCWAVAFLSLAQLVVGLDYISIWPGAEAELIWAGVSVNSENALTAMLSSIPTDSPYWLLVYRLPSLLFYLLGLGLFFVWGRNLFGIKAVEITLLVGAASLLLPVLAKTATLDTWRFGLELGFWLALLHFTKNPERRWLVWAIVLGSGAILVGSWATLVLFITAF
jgi:hypothetical protein